MKEKAIFICIILLMFNSITLARSGIKGLGIVLGKPIGVSVKYWISEKRAIDGALAYSFEDDNYIHIHINYLWHLGAIMDLEVDNILFYYGVGPSLKFGKKSLVGARVPLGLEMLLGKKGGIFLELVPVLLLTPKTDIDIHGGIGGRFYF